MYGAMNIARRMERRTSPKVHHRLPAPITTRKGMSFRKPYKRPYNAEHQKSVNYRMNLIC